MTAIVAFKPVKRFNSVNKTSREHHSIHVCKTVLSVNLKLLLNESVFGKFELSSITIPTIKGGVLGRIFGKTYEL